MSNLFFPLLALVVIFSLSSSAPTVAFNLSSEDFSFRFFAEHSIYFAKYIECSAKNLKEKSSELKLKATVGAEELKEKITTNAKSGKNKFDKLNLKEKLVKFKNSKTLTEFMEK